MSDLARPDAIPVRALTPRRRYSWSPCPPASRSCSAATVSRSCPTSWRRAFRPGDRLIVDPTAGALLHDSRRSSTSSLPAAVDAAIDAFAELARCDDDQITAFFDAFADRLADDVSFAPIAAANAADVDRAQARGRSTTRLVLSDAMRADMIAGLRGWATMAEGRDSLVDRSTTTAGRSKHDVRRSASSGSCSRAAPTCSPTPPAWCAPATPSCSASDRTRSARPGRSSSTRSHPALDIAGLPRGHGRPRRRRPRTRPAGRCSPTAGWRSPWRADPGPAVAQLGAVARQAGVPVSLHGTGGAWVVAAADADADAVRGCRAALARPQGVQHAQRVLHRRATRRRAGAGVPRRGHRCCVGTRGRWPDPRHARGAGIVPRGHADRRSSVLRADGPHDEPFVSSIALDRLGHEWEWEGSPEVSAARRRQRRRRGRALQPGQPTLRRIAHQRVAAAHDDFFATVDAPFVGDGFTRWVDGQYALDAPELGLSNWEGGRLLGRGGILSGDSVSHGPLPRPRRRPRPPPLTPANRRAVSEPDAVDVDDDVHVANRVDAQVAAARQLDHRAVGGCDLARGDVDVRGVGPGSAGIGGEE